jgi:Ser/Thr protein kinase RdoA (MazF antagonist)
MTGTSSQAIAQPLSKVHESHAVHGTRQTTLSHQIASSTFSNRVLSRLVNSDYDVGGSAKCVLIQRGVNDTYMVSAGTQRFALKIYRIKWRTRDSILDELMAIQHVNARGAHVAAPIGRRDGGLITEIHAPEGIRSAVLFGWAEGRAPKFTESADATQAGVALGRFHIAGADFRPIRIRPRMDISDLFERSLVRIRPRLRLMPSVWARLDTIVGRISSQVSQVRQQLTDWGLCHGDFTEANMRLDGENSSLFDFDWCGSGWRVFDLATFQWSACQRDSDRMAWSAFVDGYLRVRPVAAESLRFVPLFLVLRYFWHTAQIIALSSYLGAGSLSDDFFEDFVVACEGIEWETSWRA